MTVIQAKAGIHKRMCHTSECWYPEKSKMKYYVYILASKRNGTLYIGVTNNLLRRITEHKEGLGSKFTQRYQIHMLVYFEEYASPQEAIAREKQLKWWHRKWKIELIETLNPEWKDLTYDL
ncbi:MAG TPA: GIY-YIG nuclease family protein [Ignavibacteriaceae bacterium]|nr:GIY-YIG nuclease family protein [Ignavibacteriaceae bacterium]HRP94386.1 GIY-YIG nuclease family protein [Ignavibacteriaceae bacterium]HRQ55675.1 GIY-YIG nuclease family protein [Ignavibacteriaceae bacterium]